MVFKLGLITIMVLVSKMQKENKKLKKELEVKETSVDISQLPKETQDWIRRCSEKKNGLA